MRADCQAQALSACSSASWLTDGSPQTSALYSKLGHGSCIKKNQMSFSFHPVLCPESLAVSTENIFTGLHHLAGAFARMHLVAK